MGALQLVDPGLELADALCQVEDHLHSRQIHAKILDQAPYLLGTSNVVQRVEPNSALGARGNDQPLALVRPQGLGVHAQHAGGYADRKEAARGRHAVSHAVTPTRPRSSASRLNRSRSSSLKCVGRITLTSA